MADLPSDLRYTAEHEYLAQTDQDDVYRVGITDYAQGELGDIVFVELPEEGDSFEKGATFGTVEAVKAVNDALNDDPSRVNADPYGEGWMIKVRISDPSQMNELLDAAGYAPHTE